MPLVPHPHALAPQPAAKGGRRVRVTPALLPSLGALLQCLLKRRSKSRMWPKAGGRDALKKSPTRLSGRQGNGRKQPHDFPKGVTCTSCGRIRASKMIRNDDGEVQAVGPDNLRLDEMRDEKIQNVNRGSNASVVK